MGRWSARHPRRAIGAWLAFVVAVVALMVATGTDSLRNGAVGESARGYALIEQHQAGPPDREYAYVHSDRLRAADDAFQGAVLDVAAAVQTQLGSEAKFRASRDKHGVLVVGDVRQPFSVDSLRNAVLAAGARHPEVKVEQAGDVSASEARDHAVNRDLDR